MVHIDSALVLLYREGICSAQAIFCVNSCMCRMRPGITNLAKALPVLS